MLLQLDIDVPDDLADGAHVRAEALARMGGVLAEMSQAGALGAVRTMDLSKVDDTDTEEQESHGQYGAGYNDGFNNGYALGFTAADQQRVQHAAIAPQPPRDLPAPSEPLPDGPERYDYASVTPIHPGAPVQTILLPVSGGPDVIGHEHFGAPPVAFGPLLIDDPANPGHRITAAEAVRRAQKLQDAAARRPAGVRPLSGPGSPVSAYDELPATIAFDRYEFPQYPEHGRPHSDSEGAHWRYCGDRQAWVRDTYPPVWGEASTVEPLTVHMDDPTGYYAPAPGGSVFTLPVQETGRA